MGMLIPSFSTLLPSIEEVRNRITFLKDEVGNVYEDHKAINIHITSFFRNLYTTYHSSSAISNTNNGNLNEGLSSAMKATIDTPLRDTEVLLALKFFKPLKAPGPDSPLSSTRNIGTL